MRNFREICEDRGQPRSRMPVTKWHNQIGDSMRKNSPGQLWGQKRAPAQPKSQRGDLR